jgi:hypothetical protein
MALRAFADDEWVGFASDRPVGDAPVHDEDTNSPDQSTYIRIFLSEAILCPRLARINAGECRAWRRIQLNSDKDNSPILCQELAIDPLLPARVL